MEITQTQFWLLVGVLLFFGLVIGWHYGRRAALRDIYRRYPVAREVMLQMGLEDPARKWWRGWAPYTYYLVGLGCFAILGGIMAGAGSVEEPPQTAVEATAPAEARATPLVELPQAPPPR
jgi:hypothetical protein